MAYEMKSIAGWLKSKKSLVPNNFKDGGDFARMSSRFPISFEKGLFCF